ncbi:MAG TPA: PAS domain S-box protein [Sphingobacteriaceae bacterium]
MRNLVEHSHLEALIHHQNEILEMIVDGKPLATILGAIANCIERQCDDEVYASILLVDNEGRHLIAGGAAGIPEEFRDAIQGIAIAKNVFPPATAAYRKHTIVDENLASGAVWQRTLSDLAIKYDLQACCSIPLVNKKDIVLGTLTVYYKQYRKPNRAQEEIIVFLSRTAVIAIESKLVSTEQVVTQKKKIQLLSLVETSTEYMAASDIKGNLVYINKSGRKLMGIGPDDDVSVLNGRDFYAPEHLHLMVDEIEPAIYRDGKWSGVAFFRHFRSAEIIPCYADFIRIDDPVTQKPIGRGATLRDLRPELAAQKALAESENLFRRIATAAPAALWMSDESALLTYTNQLWTEWTGRPFETLLGLGWLEAVVPEDKQRVADRFLLDFSRRTAHENEFRIYNKYGTVRWLSCTGKPMYRADGSFSGYIGACVDITIQKELQQQKDDFIGIASHELKTPVTSIKGYAQMLQTRLKKADDQKTVEMVDRMHVQINRLNNLIADLLDVTRINSGKLLFRRSCFDFNEMITEFVQDVQQTSNSHDIVLHLAGTVSVFADRDRIGQVITNLIINAIKYSPGADRIIVASEIRDNTVYLSVHDFGIGISKHNCDKVFLQFFRENENMQYSSPGLGLGLYISAQIVMREGGQIWVDSEEGEGSTFHFTLPVVC